MRVSVIQEIFSPQTGRMVVVEIESLPYLKKQAGKKEMKKQVASTRLGRARFPFL